MTPALYARRRLIEKRARETRRAALSPVYALMGGLIILSFFGALALFAIAR